MRRILTALSLAGALAFSVQSAQAKALHQLRTEGYAAQRQGDSARALEDFQAAALLSHGAPSDELAVGNCAAELKRGEEAIRAYRAALDRQSELSPADVLYAFKALALQLENSGDWSGAAAAWNEVVARADTSLNRLALARALNHTSRTREAGEILAKVNSATLAPVDQASYWTEVAAAQTASDPQAALAALDKANALQDRAFRHYAKSQILRKLWRPNDALLELEQAQKLDPNNATIAFDLAYAYRALGRNEEAAMMFELASREDATAFRPVEDWAYALKGAGENKQAVQRFEQVVDNKDRYPQTTPDDKADLDRRMWRVRNEVTELDRAWYASEFFSYRSAGGGAFTTPLPESGPSQSQAGLELGWRPPDIGYVDGRIFELYARGFFSFLGDSLDYDDKSLQFGVGARWKPFSDLDLRFAVERLIKGGENARDAWLLRASYFWGDGVDLDPIATSWNYTTLYADLAYIPDDPAFFSAFAEGIEGWRIKLTERWAFTPHVVLSTQYIDDSSHTGHIVEGGPGLMLSHWFCEDTYHAPSGRVDLVVQYRVVLSNDGGANNAVLARLIFGL